MAYLEFHGDFVCWSTRMSFGGMVYGWKQTNDWYRPSVTVSVLYHPLWPSNDRLPFRAQYSQYSNYKTNIAAKILTNVNKSYSTTYTINNRNIYTVVEWTCRTFYLLYIPYILSSMSAIKIFFQETQNTKMLKDRGTDANIHERIFI